MCGNRRRAARYQGSYGRRNRREPATDGIASIIGAIQEIKLAGHGIDSRARTGYGTMPSAYTAELDAQTRGVERGVAYDYPSAADERKQAQAQKETVDFEELPSYEDSTGASKRSIPRESQPQYTPATSDASFEHMTQPHLSRSNPEAALLSNLEVFRTSLLSYSQGSRGAKKEAKHAARSFVEDLRAQEIDRIRSERGCLECGERKQVKRELKPVKDMLKGAVWEAKMERKGRY